MIRNVASEDKMAKIMVMPMPIPIEHSTVPGAMVYNSKI